MTRKKFLFLSLLEWIIVLGIMAVLTSILYPNYMRAHSRRDYGSCRTNLSNIGSALEGYAADNGGFYPESLSSLTPRYLKTIPTCPGADDDTYSKTYRLKQGEGEEGGSYEFYCAGVHHGKWAAVPEDHPRYRSGEGLVDR